MSTSPKTPPPEPPPSEKSGEHAEPLGTLGRYELVTKLATGGMGEIFLARLRGEGGFEKLTVIKRLLPELTSAEHFVSMFLDEARIAAKLSHPNVCEVYELGHEGAQYFIAMKYLEGVPFSRIMQRTPGWHVLDDDNTHLRLVAGLMQQACEGLHHAHELHDSDGHSLNLVHRDVSPSNLFVTVDGVLNVLDFGIAKARGATSQTEKGAIKGKYSYMSPEQVRGDDLDRRSDIFSLGIVAHEAVTGRRLFKRASDFLVAKAVIEEPIPRADDARSSVPAPMADAIARALARDPDERFATAREAGAALGDAVEDLGSALSATEVGEIVRQRFAEEISKQRAQYERASALAWRADAVSLLPSQTLTTPPTRSLTPATIKASPGPVTFPAARPPTASRLKLLAVAIGAIALAAAVLTMLVRREGLYKGAEERVRAAVGDAGTQREARPEPLPIASASVDAAPTASLPPPDTGPPAVRVAKRPPRPRKHPPSKPPAAKAPGFLSVDSKPYARIYIDGKLAGVTPLIRHELAPGKRRVRAVIKGGREKRFVVTIESGKEAPALHVSW